MRHTLASDLSLGSFGRPSRPPRLLLRCLPHLPLRPREGDQPVACAWSDPLPLPQPSATNAHDPASPDPPLCRAYVRTSVQGRDRNREREREAEGERQRECVCVCDRWHATVVPVVPARGCPNRLGRPLGATCKILQRTCAPQCLKSVFQQVRAYGRFARAVQFPPFPLKQRGDLFVSGCAPASHFPTA